jgi:hypothetical protein
MRRISFYDGPRNKQDILHIETDGAIVNIQVGLHDTDGRQVTSVRISPDDASRGGDGNGRIWVRDGSRIVRLHEGEDILPAPAVVTMSAGKLADALAEVDRQRKPANGPGSGYVAALEALAMAVRAEIPS